MYRTRPGLAFSDLGHPLKVKVVSSICFRGNVAHTSPPKFTGGVGKRESHRESSGKTIPEEPL